MYLFFSFFFGAYISVADSNHRDESVVDGVEVDYGGRFLREIVPEKPAVLVILVLLYADEMEGAAEEVSHHEIDEEELDEDAEGREALNELEMFCDLIDSLLKLEDSNHEDDAEVGSEEHSEDTEELDEDRTLQVRFDDFPAVFLEDAVFVEPQVEVHETIEDQEDNSE